MASTELQLILLAQMCIKPKSAKQFSAAHQYSLLSGMECQSSENAFVGKGASSGDGKCEEIPPRGTITAKPPREWP